MIKKSKVIILIGPPGSGKGTQAGLLADKFDLYHLETSKLIERAIQEEKRQFVEVEGKRYYFEMEKKLWEKGKLCNLAFVMYLLKERIKNLAKDKKEIVLSASPRRLEEGKKIIPLLEKLYGKASIKIFLLDLSVKQSIWRNSHRKICELVRHPILYNKETINLANCPLDGSKLVKRFLDKPEIIKKRFEVYQEETLPLIDYFKKEKIEIFKINGEQSVSDVFSNILKHLEK